MLNSLYSSMNQCLFKMNFCNPSSPYEYYGWFLFCIDMSTTKSTLFAVSKDEWDTKEGPGKSMKNALYVWQKASLGLKEHWTVKKLSL